MCRPRRYSTSTSPRIPRTVPTIFEIRPKIGLRLFQKPQKSLTGFCVQFLGIQRPIMIRICGSETLLDGREIAKACTVISPPSLPLRGGRGRAVRGGGLFEIRFGRSSSHACDATVVGATASAVCLFVLTAAPILPPPLFRSVPRSSPRCGGEREKSSSMRRRATGRRWPD